MARSEDISDHAIDVVLLVMVIFPVVGQWGCSPGPAPLYPIFLWRQLPTTTPRHVDNDSDQQNGLQIVKLGFPLYKIMACFFENVADPLPYLRMT